MSLFVSFKFPAVSSPYSPTLAGDGTQMTDTGSRRGQYRGTLQEGQSRSAGQGKRRTDPGVEPHSKHSVARGYRLVLHSGIPPGRL
ncbi:unnamed protein product, partial [Staurois parvus]